MGMRRSVLLLASTALVVLLASGVAVAITVVNCTGGPCEGTGGVDRIQGTENRDEIYAYGSADDVTGGDGADKILAGSGHDQILGDYSASGSDGAGNDRIYGEAGRDYIYGTGGADLIAGGPGDDYLDASEFPDDVPGEDTVKGGSDNDEIHADDGLYDFINCGGGQRDKVVYDRGLDTVAKCENKTAR
jgi:Ca2+-binding RTX toxin-like protein